MQLPSNSSLLPCFNTQRTVGISSSIVAVNDVLADTHNFRLTYFDWGLRSIYIALSPEHKLTNIQWQFDFVTCILGCMLLMFDEAIFSS